MRESRKRAIKASMKLRFRFYNLIKKRFKLIIHFAKKGWSDQKKKCAIIEENELLKSYIACEVDNMAAYAPFDELGNKMRYVQRAFFTVGHIIPELKELKKEVEITCQHP